jgi:hypothetical protein
VAWFLAKFVNFSLVIKQHLPQDAATGSIFNALQNIKTAHRFQKLFLYALLWLNKRRMDESLFKQLRNEQ